MYPQFQNSQEFALDGGAIFFTLFPIAMSLMQMKCSFQHFSVQYEFGFRNENVFRVNGGYLKKVMTHKLCQNVNFMGYHYSNWHVLLNISSISLLSRVHDTSVYFEIQKE